MKPCTNSASPTSIAQIFAYFLTSLFGAIQVGFETEAPSIEPGHFDFYLFLDSLVKFRHF